MQSRITQMHSDWKYLNELKSKRKQASQQVQMQGLDKVPPPPFNAMIPMPLVDVKNSTKSLNDDAPLDQQVTRASQSTFSLKSTPPKLTSEPRAISPTSSYDLPELPKDLDEDDLSGSRTPSPPTSYPVNDPATAERGQYVKKLRKKVSKRFSEVTNDLSEFAQKISSRSAQSSSEKSSPVRKTSPKKDDSRLACIPIAERNRIATQMAEFCLADDYRKASESGQSLMFSAKLIGLIDNYQQLINSDALKALRADLEWRMSNAIVDTEVDLADQRYVDSIKKEINNRFILTWGNDKAGEEGETKYPEVKGKMTKTFLRDFPVTSHAILTAAGKEKIDHPKKLVEFIGSGVNGNLPHIVSHIANQNLTAFLNTVLFRRESSAGAFDSMIKRWDGSPVTPKGNMRASYVYSKDSEGNIILEHDYVCSKQTTPTNLGVSPASDSFGKLMVDDHAELYVKVRVKFSPNGEWNIENPHVRARGWNVPMDY